MLARNRVGVVEADADLAGTMPTAGFVASFTAAAVRLSLAGTAGTSAD
jgi:hypothetical protein